MTRVYVAARYQRKEEVVEVVNFLSQKGIEVVSTWHQESFPSTTQLADVSTDERQMLAERDIQEIDRADVLLSLTEEPNKAYIRGGRHVEFGYALAKGKRMVCCGPAENIFHHLPGVTVVSSLHEAVQIILQGEEI